MEKLGIIGTGYMAMIIAERAKKLGIETHCFSVDDHSVAAEVSDYFHHLDILDVEKLANKCFEIGIKGVVATTELTIYPAAYVAEKLHINGNPTQVSRDITNKLIIRNKVSNVAGLEQPKYWVSYGDERIEVEKYPVIVKPIAAGGKRGISVVYSEHELDSAIQTAKDISKVKGALIEEYIDGGKEYSVESLSYHGHQHVIQITEKISSGPPHCVELGHHQPAELNGEARLKVNHIIEKVLSAAGIENGPCHTEIKIVEDKIYLIEINGRPGGDHIAYPLTELSTGYPYISGIILAALNRLNEAEIELTLNNYCGVLFVTTQTAFLKPIFDNCEDKPWFYKKNKCTDELRPITHNDGFNTNYFMYCSKEGRPDFNEFIK